MPETIPSSPATLLARACFYDNPQARRRPGGVPKPLELKGLFPQHTGSARAPCGNRGFANTGKGAVQHCVTAADWLYRTALRLMGRITGSHWPAQPKFG